MKILFCTALEPTKANGATIYTIRILRALQSLGFDIKVLVLQFYTTSSPLPIREWVPELRKLQDTGITFRVFPTKQRFDLFALAYVRLFWDLICSLRDIDVFAFRLVFFQPIPLVIKLVCQSIKTLWFHDGIIEEVYFVNKDLKHLILQKIFHLFEKYGSRFVDWEFPVSKKMLEYSHQKGICGRKGSVVLPCVVELDKFYLRPIPKKLSNDSKDYVVIGFAGSLAPWHGFENACKFVQFIGKFINVRLHVLTSETEKAKNISAQYLLEATIEWTNHDNMPSIMDNWDFALAPQKSGLITRVSSPLKVAEALSKGIPLIIAPEVGDFSEIVNSQGVGVVFDPDNHDEWGKSVLKIKEIISDYHTISLKARKLAEEFYSWDSLPQKIAQVLRG